MTSNFLIPLLQAPGSQYEQHSIVEEHYDAIHRQVDQQLEGAAQLVANRALSPQRPYPLRPKNRVGSVIYIIIIIISSVLELQCVVRHPLLDQGD